MTDPALPEGLLAQLASALACFECAPLIFDERRRGSENDLAEVARIFSERMEALERACCDRDNVPVFAHLAAEMLCHVVITCTDLAEVLARSHRFSVMFVGADRASRIERRGGIAAFSVAARYTTRDEAALLSDLIGLHYFHSLLSWLSGKRLDLIGVELAYGAPPHPNRVLDLFAAPVLFDQARNALLFDSAVLARPVVRTPAALSLILDCFPYNFIIDAIEEHGLPTQVKLLIEHALRQRKRIPSAATIAGILQLSEATLRRQLRAHGTSYLQLRAASQREAAERLMKDAATPIAAVAQHLGFSDDRAFRRAFKGWTGLSPSASTARRSR